MSRASLIDVIAAVRRRYLTEKAPGPHSSSLWLVRERPTIVRYLQAGSG
ncbi:hypothetical protein [Veronia pacifica]|nr:hypothetical protein [Veronia pacifica]